MPTVPVYNRSVRARPILQSSINVQANGNDFGAQIGQGLQEVARGAGDLGDAYAQVRALKDRSLAKQTFNGVMRDSMDYLNNPESGYLNSLGQTAIDGRDTAINGLRDIRTKAASNLTPSQRRYFDDMADSLDSSNQENILRHAARETKNQIVSDSDATAANYLDQALVSPAQADKFIAAGLSEIREKGHNLGWTPAMMQNEERSYLSSATKKQALQIAAASPNAALTFIERNAARLSADDRFDLDTKLKPVVLEANSNANTAKFLQMRRGGVDVVKEVVDAGGREDPGAPSRATDPIANAGPTAVRAFLISKAPGKGADAIDGLDQHFAGNLAALIQDAPPEIRKGLGIVSAFRSNEQQERLFANSDRTGHTVAFPAGYRKADGSIAKGSNHLHGKAVDLGWNGRLLRPGNAPQEVIDWVHSNVGRYGMFFRMGYEPWHVEPTGGGGGATVVSKSDGPTARSTMPSFDEIQTFLSGISDPVERDKTETKIFQALGHQSQIEELQQKSARQELWELWQRRGITPDQAPLETRIAAGNTAIDSLNDSIRKEREGSTVTDQTVLFGLNRLAAENPDAFKQIDLTDYYGQLSREDRKAVADSQNKLLSGDVEAQNNGLVYNAAFKQAEQALSSAGLTTTGISSAKTEERQAVETRIAKFQNSLKMEIDQFRTTTGKTPTYDETQGIINALLMKSVYTEQRSAWSLARLFDDDKSESDGGFMFERDQAPDGATVRPVVDFAMIPPEWVASIRTALTERTGKPPSRDDVEKEYSAVVLDILGRN